MTKDTNNQITDPKEDTHQQFPNRQAFAERFAKRHADTDFEDKEARYSLLNDDADRLDRYEESGKALSSVFEKHRWMASMFEALRQDDSLDPITWMADNGIDIDEALQDEEYRKQITQRITDFQKRTLEGEQAEKQREKALEKSAKELERLGLSEEQNVKIWDHLFNEVIDPALRGEISKDTWTLVQKALNYDSDIAAASEQAAMKARNEKIRNPTRQPRPADMPPTLPQGGAAPAKPQKSSSVVDDFWQGVK